MALQVFGACLFGSQAKLVRVEVQMGRGLSRVLMVGMPDAVAKEARERLPSAMARHGFHFPNGKVLFNLVPAQLPKGGLPLDLALAVALMVGSRQCPAPSSPALFLAELDLQGKLQPSARGTLLAAMAAADHEVTIVTAPNAAPEAALAPGVRAYAFEHLGQVAEWLSQPDAATPVAPLRSRNSGSSARRRLDDVRGHYLARRAAVLAAAGRHNLLLQGPPGTGKSLLARRVVDLLPKLTAPQRLELAQLEALLGPLGSLPKRPPCRAPHASVSRQGFFGGGHPIRPGEVSRAHRGVLFLDELPEFPRAVLEGLRQPLEDHELRLQRAREWVVFPADFMLVATRNPCPCGYLRHPRLPCRCTPAQVQRYRNRTSGPLLDRFDLIVEMNVVDGDCLQAPPTSPTDEEAHHWMATAAGMRRSRRQDNRFAWPGRAQLEDLQREGIVPLARQLLARAARHLPLSGRGVLRVMRVARTIADIQGRPQIDSACLREALSLRPPPEADPGTTG